jgi:hypothetical protein
MLYYLIRRADDKEPLALVRFNAREEGNMFLGLISESRFGPYVKVNRNNQHVYNILLGDNQDVIDALEYKLRPHDGPNSFKGGTNYRLEQVQQAEWETFEAFDLFPILKVAVAL